MASKPPKPLMFTVRGSKPELVAPAEPTPHEYKPLSDIDDQQGLRFHIPIISFYKYNPNMEGKDPAKVIKEAIAKTLVHYYPLAGRLREFKDNRKLVVDCTGEGLLFIEADADVTLEEFGDDIYPPFPCVDQLLYDVPGTSHVLNTPLFLIQNTSVVIGSDSCHDGGVNLRQSCREREWACRDMTLTKNLAYDPCILFRQGMSPS